MKRFKIDDVAKETGLTKRAIRYYEEIGLIKPPERSEKGTRLYTEEDIEQLKKVIAAREVLGFSLQELQHFLTLKEKIESHRFEYRNASEQEEKRRELEHVAANLRNFVRSCFRFNNALFTSYVMEVSPYERGITSGMYNFVRWMGAAIAPVLSGVIGHSISAKAPFMVAMVLTLIAFAFLSLRKQQPSVTQTN